MPTIKKLMLNGIAYKWGESPTPDDALLLESGKEILLENGDYLAKERLLSYEDIKAMASGNDVETELNKYPLEYYNKFNSEGHLIATATGYSYALCPIGTTSRTNADKRPYDNGVAVQNLEMSFYDNINIRGAGVD